MPKSQKPIAAIFISENLLDINFDRFINPSSVGEIIANRNEPIFWARQNKIESAFYKSNEKIFKNKSDYMRDCDMVNAADVAIFFWTKGDSDLIQIVRYAVDHQVPYYLHEIFEK